MLWLAGLLGMMVVGSMTAFMPSDAGAEDEAQPGDNEEAPDTSDGLDILEQASAPPSASALPQTIQQSDPSVLGGSDADNLLQGTGLTDLMNGHDGDDTLDGGANDDELFGGTGDDLLNGGDDNDTLHGEAGSDTLIGDGGNDQLFGHDGDDTLVGGAGDDELQGGLGDDSLMGAEGNDALHGREGNDTLTGGTGTDTLFGGDGDDVLNGSNDVSTDYLNANDGDDTLNVGADDIATGGEGQDQFILEALNAGQTPSTLMDFDAAEDQLVIVYDDSDGSLPEVTLSNDSAAPGLVNVQVDGLTVTTLPAATAPQVDAIALVGQSVALPV